MSYELVDIVFISYLYLYLKMLIIFQLNFFYLLTFLTIIFLTAGQFRSLLTITRTKYDTVMFTSADSLVRLTTHLVRAFSKPVNIEQVILHWLLVTGLCELNQCRLLNSRQKLTWPACLDTTQTQGGHSEHHLT